MAMRRPLIELAQGNISNMLAISQVAEYIVLKRCGYTDVATKNVASTRAEAVDVDTDASRPTQRGLRVGTQDPVNCTSARKATARSTAAPRGPSTTSRSSAHGSYGRLLGKLARIDAVVFYD
jgi:hypothetical protein